ncbi:MHYT domain-containing protein [Streptomyces sp. NPDC059176]|uniref:MHYT domain-containing protein n=1 Tax=unclassified Streptomyces TaxID=2593676 RepID=UPI0036B60826
MQGTVDSFSHGLATPVAAYLAACLGAALGLRCTVRSLRARGAHKPGWLALGAASIGSGTWMMHFVAMMGFTVEEAAVGYDWPVTFAGLGVAVLMTGLGIFVVGYRGASAMSLVTGGTITGLGIASMHYLGMAGMRLQGTLEYDTRAVSLSVVIAVTAATAALWAAVSGRGVSSSVGASLMMGLAAGGLHYTGMAAVSVHVHDGAPESGLDGSPATLIAPMLIGPALFLVLAGVVVVLGRGAVMGHQEPQFPGAPGLALRPGVPTQRSARSHGEPAYWSAEPSHTAHRTSQRSRPF